MSLKSNVLQLILLLFLSTNVFSAEAKNHPDIFLPVVHENMSKSDWLTFARVGGGYYPMPEELTKYIPAVNNFLNTFYRDKEVTKKDFFYIEWLSWAEISP
jgi:hypothetical protein